MSTLFIDSSEVQGNILTAFGRDKAVYLFLQFSDKNPAKLRAALGDLLMNVVTSAAEQECITRTWKSRNAANQIKNRSPEVRQSARAVKSTQKDGQSTVSDDGSKCVGMFGLSAEGYKKLGLSDEFPDPENDELGSSLFKAGLKQSAYMDSQLEFWSDEFKTKTVDAFLLLSDNNENRLRDAVTSARNAIAAGIGESSKPVSVYRRPDAGGLGFRDGIAEPQDRELIFTPERSDSAIDSRKGCFALLMKMEQDGDAFAKKCGKLAGLARMKPKEVQELAVGRRKNGQPLVSRTGPGLNDFNFYDAPSSKCPFHAHIRAMNPRVNGDQTPQIVRRGMNYGPDPIQAAQATKEKPPSGLMFLSFQRSLLDVYFLIQRALWLRDPLLSRQATWSEDVAPATAGENLTLGPSQLWTFANGGGPPKTISYPIADITKIRGGEYFYIPSMPFIRALRTVGDSKSDQSVRSPSSRTVPHRSSSARTARAGK